MDKYGIEVTRSASREIRRLGPQAGRRVMSAMVALAYDPHPTASARLTGSGKAFRLRVGDYRILYTVNEADKTVQVYAVGHRSDVYR